MKRHTTDAAPTKIRNAGVLAVFVWMMAQGCLVQAFVPNSPTAFIPFSTKAIVAATTTTTSTTSLASTLTRLPESAVELTLQIPGEATKAAYDKACNELSKQISIPGFRKGTKIPPAVLEQNMAAKGGRNALRVEAINSLAGKLVEHAIKDEHGLEPIGQPSLVVPAEELADTFAPGQELMLQVKCDVWPDIQWKEGEDKPYLGLKGKYERKPFDQEKLDKALNDLRERYATLQPGEPGMVLADGDSCRVNMVGYMATADGQKGEALPNAASGDNVEIIIGPGRYMEGLVEGIVGASVGDKRQVTVQFPVNLRDKTLAGKNAIFDVEILEASHRTLPEVTDEFAKMVRADLTAESLMKELQKAVDSEDAKEYTPARNKALSDALAEVMDVEVPDTLVTNQAREKFAVMMTEMRDNGVSDEEIKKQITPENFLKYKKVVKKNIVKDFKVSMATDEIARMEGIEVPDYQVQEQLENIRKDAEKNKEEFDESMIRAKVETTLVRQMVFDFLAQHAELEVEYKDGEDFDSDLMEKLMKDSLDREAKMAAEATGTSEAELKAKADEEAKKAEAEAVAAAAKAEAEEAAATAKAEAEEAAKAAEAEAAAAKAQAEAAAAAKAQKEEALAAAAKAQAEALVSKRKADKAREGLFAARMEMEQKARRASAPASSTECFEDMLLDQMFG